MTQNLILSEIILCVCAGWDICVSADGSLHSCGVSHVPGLLRGARHHAHIWWISLPSVCTSRSQKIGCSHWSTAPIEIWRFYLTSFLLSSTSCSLAGVSRLSVMVEKMLGKKPNLFFRVCWQYLSPMLVLVRKRKPDNLGSSISPNIDRSLFWKK